MQFGNANSSNSNVDFNGLIYAPGSTTAIQFGNNNVIQGSVLSGGTVSLGNNTGVIFDATTQAAIASIVVADTGGVCHYELSLPGSGINCLATPVTVTACADTSSPCTNKYTAATGMTVTLATNGGTLAATTVALDATGVASTTLSYPAAADGTSVAVTLSGEQSIASNPRQCCPDGVNCVAANSCSSTFHKAGFIFSSTVGGGVATIPAQVAGTSSGNYYLRAVKTLDNTSHTCGAAFVGTQSINLGYECNNPATCYGSNLMSVGGAAIARNDNGSVASYTGVNLTFDANGNAPFSFNYDDVGHVKLWANKTVANSAVLTGSTNSFLVKPFDFGVVPCQASVAGACITLPADPGVVGGGSVFAKAGEAFKATVTARTFGGLATPSFGSGSNNTTETVNLTHTLVAPAGGVNGSLAGTISIPRNSFSNGSVTVSDLSWSEVGVITLTATNSTLLGNVLTTTGTSGNVGRFYPDHFETTTIAPMTCTAGLACPAGGLSYSGQPFTTIVTAKNAAGGTTQNYSGAFAHEATLSAWNAAGGAVAAGGSMSANIIPAASFVLGVATTLTPSYQFPLAPSAPADIFIRAVETAADGVTSLRVAPAVTVEGGIKVASGRIKIGNAHGSELLPLPMTATVQYWNGTNWLTSETDNSTSLTFAAANVIKNGLTTGTTTPTGAASMTGGKLTITLSKPTGGVGVATISPGSPAYLPLISGLATFGVYKGNNDFIYMRESY